MTNATQHVEMSGRDGIVLVGASTGIVGATDDAMWAALTSAERARGLALRRPEDRHDFLAAHLLVRRAAALLTDANASAFVIVQCCSDCGGAHGRPSVLGHPELYVSMSHTNGVVAAACSRRPIGVDIEHWESAPTRHDDFSHVFCESEQTVLEQCAQIDCINEPSVAQLAFLRLWVRKESLIKIGDLTLDTLHAVDVCGASLTESAANRWHRRTLVGRWRFLDWGDPGLRIAGCAVGDGDLELIDARLLDAPELVDKVVNK